MSDPVSLTSIGVDLGGLRVLQDLTLKVASGEIVGVVGSNGSGKTTLIRVISTLLAPRSGEGTVFGAELGSPGVYDVRSRIGMISHQPAVIPELTLHEHLTHLAKLRGADPSRVSGALRVVGLDQAADRRAEASSFGMLRRTEIAGLLMSKPDLLLLDEAFSGLDQQATALVDALIDRTLADAGSAILVSHEKAHMGRANRVYGLIHGALEQLV